MKFYLGTHMTNWLGQSTVPLFISARRLRRIKKKYPTATCDWALDSGGFSEISMFGEWRTSPEQYAAEAELWSNKIGRMDWAAIQDWMCEPDMLQKTGKTITEHQELTIESMLKLSDISPNIPWMPVLQGWDTADYERHLEMYRSAGHSGMSFGIGSVCRRQNTDGVGRLIKKLSSDGLMIHAFGFKTRGLAVNWNHLSSADSLAWSYAARRSDPIPGHTHGSCANCFEYAMGWRDRMLQKVQPVVGWMSEQLELPGI